MERSAAGRGVAPAQAWNANGAVDAPVPTFDNAVRKLGEPGHGVFAIQTRPFLLRGVLVLAAATATWV